MFCQVITLSLWKFSIWLKLAWIEIHGIWLTIDIVNHRYRWWLYPNKRLGILTWASDTYSTGQTSADWLRGSTRLLGTVIGRIRSERHKRTLLKLKEPSNAQRKIERFHVETLQVGLTSPVWKWIRFSIREISSHSSKIT